MTLQQNWELHQKLTDQKHWSVGWDVTLQRMPSGELEIVVFMNANHSFLPDSATIDI